MGSHPMSGRKIIFGSSKPPADCWTFVAAAGANPLAARGMQHFFKQKI
jgi:hypothetical protein